MSTLQGCKNEDLKVAELAADNPRLVHAKKLLYTVSRLTLDSKAKPGQVKGFVVNPRKDDVKVFDLSENDDQVSPFFITNYIWDLIAAGTDPSWTKLALYYCLITLGNLTSAHKCQLPEVLYVRPL